MDYGSTVTTELDGETPVGKPLALKSAAERARCLLRAGQPRAATRASTASWRRDRDARCAPRTPPGSPSPAPAGRRFLRPAPRAAGSDDPQEQAKVIPEESEERTEHPDPDASSQ